MMIAPIQFDPSLLPAQQEMDQPNQMFEVQPNPMATFQMQPQNQPEPQVEAKETIASQQLHQQQVSELAE